MWKKTKILVKKPQAPIKGEFDWMGVKLKAENIWEIVSEII